MNMVEHNACPSLLEIRITLLACHVYTTFNLRFAKLACLIFLGQKLGKKQF